MVLLVDQIAGHVAVRRQVGKLVEVLLDASRVLGPPATIIQVDLDQLHERQVAQGRRLSGQEIRQPRRLARRFPGGDQRLDPI